MKILSITAIAGIMAAMLLIPAHSEEVKVTGQLKTDLDFLDGFDIIIGDSGQRFDGWSERETRVFAEVYDGRTYHEHYFDNLPAMMFVLRENYERASITWLEVPDYSAPGRGLIDGRYAWYVWDHDRYSRGGTPLVLAFSGLADARREAGRREASLLSYEDMLWRLYDWSEQAHERVYWRGWDRERWSDEPRWQRAYDEHWQDPRWDDSDGFLSVELKLGDFTLRYEDDDIFGEGGRYRDYEEYPGHYHERPMQYFEFDKQDARGRRWTSESGGDHDRGHGNDPDGFDEDNPGQGHGKGNSGNKGKGNKDKNKDKDKDKGNGKGNGKAKGSARQSSAAQGQQSHGKSGRGH
ncbi:hypothetical protein KDL44_10715 [bacterium]|nr:hypothetical protein [bacterium]